MDGEPPVPDSAPPKSGPFALRQRAWRTYLRRRWGRVAAVIIVSLGVVGFVGHTLGGIAGLWEFYHFTGKVRGAGGDAASGATAPRPFRSLAVLPFRADEASAAQAAQLTADLTNAARRSVRDGLVVSNALAQSIGTGAQDPRKVGAELNVRYVVVGSLRSHGGVPQLSIELVDSANGAHLWSTQARLAGSSSADAVTRLANGLEAALYDASKRELPMLPKVQRDALALLFRAEELPFTPANWRDIQSLCDEALRIDPDLVPALLLLQRVLFQRAQEEPQNRAAIVAQFDKVSQHAITVASSDPRVWNMRAFALQWQGNWNGAFAANDKALRLDPDSFDSLRVRAWLFVYTGQPEEALRVAARAGELADQQLNVSGCVAYTLLASDRDAAAMCEKAVAVWDFWILHGFVAAAYASMGDREATQRWVAKLRAAKPDVTIRSFTDLGVSEHPDWVAQGEHFRAGLRKAGVPER